MQIQFRQFHPDDTEQTVALWQACGLTRPWNDPHKDIERKLQQEPELFIVAERDGLLLGSVMAGYDGHRGWIYYLSVLPQYQSQGLGKKLVQQAEQRLRSKGCPKIQLMIRLDNSSVQDFYRALGYEQAEVVVLGKRLIEDA
ncbi:ribosomal protein S18 acetylase RimI-like enzyme [Advenella incenata]|jgi:ribosomal protein S18 acetylase RimI-like enzyme|uniref:Ribosomal protein S18 acetylase RimI-like enzyme n=1 Tax=Advenella incenata TaxID=267800 RepID=A0A4Q7V8I0_9BURK|nr:GNAT family acetyltransferase [Advenella incenata]RZT93011.1 ribosomal protein S18 acetylase RimI-like enzyme [Advenella incenata]